MKEGVDDRVKSNSQNAGEAKELGTYMEELCILPDLTLLYVVLLRVLEAGFEILLAVIKGQVFEGFKFVFDIVECDGTLDHLVIIRVLSL